MVPSVPLASDPGIEHLRMELGMPGGQGGQVKRDRVV